MEESKLNFNVPFLSVRRLSSTSSTTGHIIPFDTDTVTEPVAVPFQWEQIPGKAKGATKHDVCSKALDTFSAYPQQMSPFSPAASTKVMTLKTPPYTSREQCMSLEQSREIREVAVNIIPYYEDSYNLSTTLCGLLPRLCFLNSMRLFNHVPGLKVRTREVTKPENKSDSAIESYMLPVIGKSQSWGSNRLTSSNDMQMVHWCPPERSPGSARIPPYRRERPRLLFSGRGFLGIPKEAEKFKANMLVAYLSTKQGSDSLSAVMEKTLHVEPASVMTGSGNSCSSSFYDKADQGEAKGGSDYAHLPPPLPKTPSESWLSRALPAVASRNSFSKS